MVKRINIEELKSAYAEIREMRKSAKPGSRERAKLTGQMWAIMLIINDERRRKAKNEGS